MVVGTATPTTGLWGAACRPHDTSGHDGVPAGLVVGGVHLVDGGDSASASDELHTPASLHFASSKEMLRCAKNACYKCMFQVFMMFLRYVAIVSEECCYIAMVVPYVAKVCSQYFIYVFGRIVANVFIWMLHTFHTYAASILSGYYVCLQWFSSCFHVFL
jgi:hypothetical protein